jgi:hypothetical protein
MTRVLGSISALLPLLYYLALYTKLRTSQIRAMLFMISQLARNMCKMYETHETEYGSVCNVGVIKLDECEVPRD